MLNRLHSKYIFLARSSNDANVRRMLNRENIISAYVMSRTVYWHLIILSFRIDVTKLIVKQQRLLKTIIRILMGNRNFSKLYHFLHIKIFSAVFTNCLTRCKTTLRFIVVTFQHKMNLISVDAVKEVRSLNRIRYTLLVTRK